LFQGCDFTPSLPGDGIDNDCDGKTDEELIDDYGKGSVGYCELAELRTPASELEY